MVCRPAIDAGLVTYLLGTLFVNNRCIMLSLASILPGKIHNQLAVARLVASID
jgi:hypothetical protein